MAYQSRTRKFEQEPRLYNTKLVFNTTENVDLPNGLTVSRPVAKFTKWAAPYRNTATLIQSIDGFNAKTDKTYAIRKTANDEIGKLTFDPTEYIVTVDGIKDSDLSFNVQQVSQASNDTKNSYHLVTLRKKESY